MTRDEAYKSLYNLIFKGFLIGGMEIGNSLFVFKTITEREFEMIRACSGSQNNIKGYLGRFNMHFLTRSVLAVDGENVLTDKKALTELPLFFGQIPARLFKNIMSELEKMRNESYDVLKYLEGFCYTGTSRRMWRTFKNITPNSEAMTGISGTSSIGMNIHQENWMYINRVIDDEDLYDRELSLSLLVASASNPKGARQTRNHHDSHMKNVEDHRKRLAEVGYIDVKNWSESGWAAPVDTAEELVAELDRQMKGMKDRHDRFIENYMKRMREKAEAKAKEAEERIKAARKQYDLPALTVEQRPLTAEETAQMIYKRKRPTTVSVPTENYVEGNASARVMSKTGSRILTARR